MSTTSRTRRTPEDWTALAEEILPQLQAGSSLTDYSDRIGSNVEAVRVALARLGYDPHGNPVPFKELTASTPKTLAKRVASRRQEKTPWWRIQAETGKSYSSLINLMREFGYTDSGESTGNGDGS